MVTIYSIGLHELPPIQKISKETPTVNVSVNIVERRSCTRTSTGMADIGLVAYPKKIRACSHLLAEMLVLICHPAILCAPKVKLSEIACTNSSPLSQNPHAPGD